MFTSIDLGTPVGGSRGVCSGRALAFPGLSAVSGASFAVSRDTSTDEQLGMYSVSLWYSVTPHKTEKKSVSWRAWFVTALLRVGQTCASVCLEHMDLLDAAVVFTAHALLELIHSHAHQRERKRLEVSLALKLEIDRRHLARSSRCCVVVFKHTHARKQTQKSKHSRPLFLLNLRDLDLANQSITPSSFAFSFFFSGAETRFENNFFRPFRRSTRLMVH